jgi:hypothetical protein
VSVVIGLILYDEFEQCTWVHISLIWNCFVDFGRTW